MTATRRELLVALALCLGGAALVLVGSALPWARLDITGRELVPGEKASLTFSASEVGRGEVGALGVVALAAVGALLAVRGRFRAPLGLLLLAAGVGTVAVGVAFATGEVAVDATDDLGAGAGLGQVPPEMAYGWVVVVAGGVLLVLAGLLTVARGGRWPGLGARYAAPAARPEEDEELWEALDRGEDPT